MDKEVPNRAHTLYAKLEGDTADDLACALRNLASKIEREQLGPFSVLGGPNEGWIVVYERSNKTHDEWALELEKYLEAKRAEKSTIENRKS